jgi:4'-phosphopantetheinyl transferase
VDEPGPREVHIWRVQVSSWSTRLSELASLLSEDERQRVSRFVFARERERFTVARGSLRSRLARYIGRPPSRLRFAYSAYGKPQIDGMQFNVAHAGDEVLLAFSRRRVVGVDVECIGPDVDVQALAPMCFGARERALLSRGDVDARAMFFRLWTRKEAWLKAIGLGLSWPLLDVDVSVPGAPPVVTGTAAARFDRECCYCVYDLPLRPGYSAAFAVEGPEPPDTSCWTHDE